MTITGEQVRTAYAAAPAPIREAFSSEDTTKIILDLQNRHKLHVDSTGVLGRQVGYLLLGLISPMEFLGGLVEAGVSAEAAKDIVSEVNEQVFIPLRAKMQGVQPTPRPTTTPAPASIPVREYPEARPVTAPLVPAPSLQAAPVHGTQVFASATGWPGAPAGNWQPAAAVHVYVPGPAPMHPQSSPYTVVHPEQPIQASTPIPTTPPAEPAFNAPQSEPTVRTIRPIPAPPANLPGAPVEKPIEKAYVADPYREQM